MENAQQQKYRLMTETPVKKLVCKLAIPTIISMLVTSFYNMADTYFVAKLGPSATAAVGIVSSVMFVIQATGFFFGHGSGNFISRALGSHDDDTAEKVAATGFFSAFIFGTLFLIFGLTFLKPLASLLGAPEDALTQTMDYMRLILVGAPYMTASLVLNNQLRFQGNAFYAMVGLTTGAVLNIILDPIMIYGWLGFPAMGVAGAALATIISQLVSFLLLLRGVQRSSAISIRFRNFRPRFAYYKIIINGGTPSLLRQGLGVVATVSLNVSAGAYGTIAIAGMSVVTRIMQFANSCLIGFGQGFQPVCGFNYGAERYDRVKEAFWFCVRTAVVVLVVLAIVGYIFAPQIVTAIGDDAQVVEIGQQALRMQCITFPLAAWIVMCNMMMQTVGKAIRASILAMSRQGLFFVPAVLLLPRLFGLQGLFCAQPFADIVSFIVSIPLAASLLREMSKAQK